MGLSGTRARVVVGVPARVFVRISLFSLGQLMEKKRDFTVE